jgi:hypothetical protein
MMRSGQQPNEQPRRGVSPSIVPLERPVLLPHPSLNDRGESADPPVAGWTATDSIPTRPAPDPKGEMSAAPRANPQTQSL